jgi:hypothetical protein
MESKIFGPLGKVAGLAGIALGVVLLVFQGMLQKQFLPQAGLDSAEAFAIILSLMILTFGIGGIGVLAWLISGSQSPHAPISGNTLALLATFMLIIVVAAVFLGWQAKREPTAASAPQPQAPIGGGAAGAPPVSEFDLRLQQTDADIIWSNEVRRQMEAIIPRHNARLYVGLGGEKKPNFVRIQYPEGYSDRQRIALYNAIQETFEIGVLGKPRRYEISPIDGGLSTHYAEITVSSDYPPGSRPCRGLSIRFVIPERSAAGSRTFVSGCRSNDFRIWTAD